MKDIHDVIKHTKFGDDRLRCSGVVAGQISAFPIDFAGRPYNTLTLPCERVIFCTYVGRDYSSLGIEIQCHRSRSRMEDNAVGQSSILGAYLLVFLVNCC